MTDTREPAGAHDNLAWECCQRWAADRARFALYYEDQAGCCQAWSFWDIQRLANRLSNALGALGTLRGERIAIILPQRPEAAVAHIACYQMGAIAVPLSPALDEEKLAARLARSEVRIAITEDPSLPQSPELRERLPNLRHVITLAAGSGGDKAVHNWTRLLEYAAPRYNPQVTSAADAALIISSGDAAEPAEDALLGHGALCAALPGLIAAHNGFPQTADMLWSPTDWDTTQGLFGGLLLAWHFGQPILAYRGGFDPAKAFWLMAKYGIRNTQLSPAALTTMMGELPKPKEKYGPDLNLRSIAGSGAIADEKLKNWVQAELGVTLGEAPAIR